MDLQLRIAGVHEQGKARAQDWVDAKSGTAFEHVAGKREEPVEVSCIGGCFLHVDHGTFSIVRSVAEGRQNGAVDPQTLESSERPVCL